MDVVKAGDACRSGTSILIASIRARWTNMPSTSTAKRKLLQTCLSQALTGGVICSNRVVQLHCFNLLYCIRPWFERAVRDVYFNVSLLCQNDNLDQYWAPRGPGTTFTI